MFLKFLRIIGQNTAPSTGYLSKLTDRTKLTNQLTEKKFCQKQDCPDSNFTESLLIVEVRTTVCEMQLNHGLSKRVSPLVIKRSFPAGRVKKVLHGR